MSKFSIDYSSLENVLYKKSYKLNQVKDRIEKVAFDIVRFKDNDKGADLWQIQKADDGEYIVALYQPDDDVTTKTSSPWEVTVNKTATLVQISYKGDPLVKLSTSRLGLPTNELKKIEEYLPTKLSENKRLVKALLNELGETAKKDVLSKYPELV